jgi:hypothetical protein
MTAPNSRNSVGLPAFQLVRPVQGDDGEAGRQMLLHEQGLVIDPLGARGAGYPRCFRHGAMLLLIFR